MRNHRSEIPTVAGCQPSLSPDGNGSDAAIGVTLGAPSRQVEKACGLLRVQPLETVGVRKEAPGEGFGRGGERPAEKLTPSQRTDTYRFASSQPSDQLRFLRTAWHQGINQEIDVQVYHGELSARPYRLDSITAAFQTLAVVASNATSLWSSRKILKDSLISWDGSGAAPKRSCSHVRSDRCSSGGNPATSDSIRASVLT